MKRQHNRSMKMWFTT